MYKIIIGVLFICSLLGYDLSAIGTEQVDEPQQLENPMSVDYLKDNLKGDLPRIILTKKLTKDIRKKVKKDAMVKNYYAAIKINADVIRREPLLTRKQVGRRLLSVSREMLYRMGILGMVYQIEKDKEVLRRIDEEVKAVCNFSDWNPSHYLDVAEMSFAVALALDWTAGDLPTETQDLIIKSLIDKGIKPSYNKEGNVGWINGRNNWNQVCNGGMIAASIAIAERDPALASKTIHRALEGMPHALEEYGPDGVYPEGSTYWGYGTSFSVLTSSMLRTAFGKDFGLAEFPAFLESADFRLLCNTPSGYYYNFADCGDKRGANGDIVLAWFATHTGNPIYLERDRFLRDPASMGKLSRIAGPGLVWLSQFVPKSTSKLPIAWKGDGSNPIAIFRGGNDDPRQYYFGGKGGKATISHGNMDAGSFIFELDGVRWVVDPGNQSYHTLEKTGFNLWGRCQECERWTLLTKNNYGHSTLTVNGALHQADGFATLEEFTDGTQPNVSFEMTDVFSGTLSKAERRFSKDGDHSLLIEDEITLNDNTEEVTWQVMTTADVSIEPGRAILRKDGKMLTIDNESHPDLMPSMISLDPPPLALDRKIEGLKRIEFRYPAYYFDGGVGQISVRLSGE
ncbi:MAG: hypothetical protein HKN87_03760 [Saprospiraceae bacterium]|nr:hypothetical protein [Saprospiraceae bacterium]